MTIERPDISLSGRKGIYQAFDANGNVVADERWRSKAMLGGGLRIDTETVRIAPFVEARNESISFELAPDLTPRRLIINAQSGRRESRIDISPGRADVCWRCDDLSRTREFLWAEDCEIGYNSALFSMVALWRRALAPGESATVRLLRLDDVSFEPLWVQSTVVRLGQERHDTRFGAMDLAHYRVSDSGQAEGSSHRSCCDSSRDWWCDQTGVIFDFVASNGSGYKLVAVNFTG